MRCLHHVLTSMREATAVDCLHWHGVGNNPFVAEIHSYVGVDEVNRFMEVPTNGQVCVCVSHVRRVQHNTVTDSTLLLHRNVRYCTVTVCSSHGLLRSQLKRSLYLWYIAQQHATRTFHVIICPLRWKLLNCSRCKKPEY